MEAANGISSVQSKVIVQFADPDGLFDTVAPLLQNRLPLGNLHWKSPTRPLRSIEELDIALEKEERPSSDGTATARRHQIPGLRQTAFVKVLLLRCDDKDKYKESVRKQVKDWVKSLGLAPSGKSSTKGQERHDAYEYLILHVVLPGTLAASQPKSSKHISVEATDSTDSVNSKSKWTGKSTSTILDKLRADFASSSKAPFERVGQIRLTDPEKPSAVLSPLELEEQWQDLIEKLKIAILQSFDARVTQYEDDIRERERQRSLPGWNFCTFFILKEGLARGFENVGLLEDALQLYEELDAGLDALIQDQSTAENADAASALLPYAHDLKDSIRNVLATKDEEIANSETPIPLSLQAWARTEADVSPWRLDRRNYQQMILTNQISALDFRVYIFIRQMQIMLRRAGLSTPASRQKSSKRESGSRWDATILTNMCERSVNFTNLAARNLRQDLIAAWGGQEGLPEGEILIQQIAIDNMVASWKWASLLQTLSDCQIISALTAMIHHTTNSQGHGPEVFSPTDIADSRRANDRRESVSTSASVDGASSINGAVNPEAKDVLAPLRIARGQKSDLVFCAAELFAMLRTILLQRCLHAGTLSHLTVNLFPSSILAPDAISATTGVLAPSLKTALQDETAAIDAYKLLTICACQCYTSAGKTRTANQFLFDLAALEAHNGKYEAAAAWLDVVPGFMDNPPETATDQAMLKLYMQCLREAGRKEELLRCLFLELSSAAATASTRGAQDVWTDITHLSEEIHPRELPLQTVVSLEKLDTHIQHSTSLGDVCNVAITLRSLVNVENLEADDISLECLAKGQHLPANLLFRSHESLGFVNGKGSINLYTSNMTEGWYDAKSLLVSFGNLTFRHDFRLQQLTSDDQSEGLEAPKVVPSIYLFSHPQSPKAQVHHAPTVDLAEKRFAHVSITWGHNLVQCAEVRLKPATAGARLDLASAHTIQGPALELVRVADSQILRFGTIDISTVSIIEIPYSLDEIGSNISLRIEIKYETEKGSSTLFDTLSFPTFLPIGVNVQDIFQKHTTVSRYTISPSRLVPISVISCALASIESCAVSMPEPWELPVVAFPKQPAQWIVQSQLVSEQAAPGAKLALDVDYQCFDEVILESVSNVFLEALQASPFAYAQRPLLTHLRHKIQVLWSENDVELATLLMQYDLENLHYDLLDWKALLFAFPKPEREQLAKWLKLWHDGNPTILLRLDKAPIRHLKLRVDPPQTELMIVAKIELEENRICVVGQPTFAILVVEIYRRKHNAQSQEIEVMVEISTHQEQWLVGGQRKAVLTSSMEHFTGNIVLIPQKTGNLLLPGIDVRCRFLDSPALPANSSKPVEFEVENTTAARSVMVRSDIRNVTIGFGTSDGEIQQGHDGVTGQHWLVASTLHAEF